MIEVSGLHIRAGVFRLDDISFRVNSGAYAVLMGKSGGGKTTILEAICGLRAFESGSIRLDEREISALPPAARMVGYVPQDLALFSHLTVRENLGFALNVRRIPENGRIDELAGWLGIAPLLDRYPAGLSGGEAQRVALGRALAFQPSVLLLDEPLSALDEATRIEMHGVLHAVRERTRVTTLHVTHHREDAKALADVVMELRDGKIVPVS
ncbi:MAG: Sulfate/thiosulfate import ATP-binding protein CysA [Verrucomicrobiota bacterium]|jgi:ABC-type sugar transport system ATPase subunit